MSQKILGIPFAVFGGLVLVVVYLIVKDKGKRVRSGMGSIQMPKIVSDNKLVFGIVVGFAVCWLMGSGLVEGMTLPKFGGDENGVGYTDDDWGQHCCASDDDIGEVLGPGNGARRVREKYNDKTVSDDAQKKCFGLDPTTLEATAGPDVRKWSSGDESVMRHEDYQGVVAACD